MPSQHLAADFDGAASRSQHNFDGADVRRHRCWTRDSAPWGKARHLPHPAPMHPMGARRLLCRHVECSGFIALAA